MKHCKDIDELAEQIGLTGDQADRVLEYVALRVWVLQVKCTDGDSHSKCYDPLCISRPDGVVSSYVYNYVHGDCGGRHSDIGGRSRAQIEASILAEAEEEILDGR